MARGPRKVRVYRNLKKSPNWYVEWRDLTGRRHCESCGANEGEARSRAQQITAELREMRRAAMLPGGTATELSMRSDAVSALAADEKGVVLRAKIRCAQVEVPVELVIALTPELREAIASVVHDSP